MSELNASLRLAAQEDHEIRVVAGLGAQRLIRNDEGRSWHHPGDTIQYVWWNDNPVECCLCTPRVSQHPLDVATVHIANSIAVLVEIGSTDLGDAPAISLHAMRVAKLDSPGIVDIVGKTLESAPEILSLLGAGEGSLRAPAAAPAL